MRNMETNFIVPNSRGIHVRPATLLVNTAARYDADIKVRNGDEFVSAKSFMGWMSLGASKGTVVTVWASGDDAAIAMEEISFLFQRSFDEA